MNMEAKLWFMVLCGLAVLLSYLAGFWRRKTAAAAFAAARAAATAKERDRYCRLAVLAGELVEGTAERPLFIVDQVGVP